MDMLNIIDFISGNKLENDIGLTRAKSLEDMTDTLMFAVNMMHMNSLVKHIGHWTKCKVKCKRNNLDFVEIDNWLILAMRLLKCLKFAMRRKHCFGAKR